MLNKIRKTIGLLLIFVIISGCFTSEVQSFFLIPSQQRLTVGDKIDLKLNFPKKILANLSLSIDEKSKKNLHFNGYPINKAVFKYNNISPTVTRPGKINMELKLFGVIPIRTMNIEVLPKVRLVPGGHSIGVLLHSQGVMIVGQSLITDLKGHQINPAKEAGIDVGDIIIKINGFNVTSDEQVASIINKEGKEGKDLFLKIKRNGKILSKQIKPIFCRETERYRVGLYVRDSAAGVGTLSFYDPFTKNYGALGHVITDSDTNQIIGVGDGKIVGAAINGIQPGTVGHPGEKLGIFVDNNQIKGNIEKNTNYGLYGKIKTPLQNPFYPKPLPIALAKEIEIGKAEILTVLDGQKIEKYEIAVEKILPQQVASGKGLVIRITDKRLLKKTGGIIQGMSGSPIIQNGKIIGSVTHVFVNDPTKGYGILIEWMLKETNIEQYYRQLENSKQNKVEQIAS